MEIITQFLFDFCKTCPKLCVEEVKNDLYAESKLYQRTIVIKCAYEKICKNAVDMALEQNCQH
jgi:hypothetical protein